MRTLLIAGLGAALASSAANAQRVVRRGAGAGYPVPGIVTRPLPPRPVAAPVHDGRWERRDGRWVGGLRAPGGYGAYRAPYVGYALPRYWVQPGFAIPSWSAYGLPQPAPGYRWHRYNDDAVLVDVRGSVHDHIGGIAWEGDDYGPADYAYDDAPVAPDYPQEYYDRAQRERREDGRGGRWVSPDGRTVVTAGGGHGHGGATTVMVQSAPVVTTTTTTEYYDDVVSYSRPAPRVAHRRVYRPSKMIRR